MKVVILTTFDILVLKTVHIKLNHYITVDMSYFHFFMTNFCDYSKFKFYFIFLTSLNSMFFKMNTFFHISVPKFKKDIEEIFRCIFFQNAL